VLSVGYVCDDDCVINIMNYLNFDGPMKIWLEPGATTKYYPPVFSAFWTQIRFWRLDSFGFHLVNIILHIINALLIWSCLEQLKIPIFFWAASRSDLNMVRELGNSVKDRGVVGIMRNVPVK
jgi:hypothetical protein